MPEYQRFIYFRRINKKAQRKYPEKESWKIFADFSSPLRLQSYAFKSYNKIFSQINFIKLLGNFFFSASPKSFPFQPLLEGCIGISLAIIQLVEGGAKFPVFAWPKSFFLYATTRLSLPHSGLATWLNHDGVFVRRTFRFSGRTNDFERRRERRTSAGQRCADGKTPHRG